MYTVYPLQPRNLILVFPFSMQVRYQEGRKEQEPGLGYSPLSTNIRWWIAHPSSPPSTPFSTSSVMACGYASKVALGLSWRDSGGGSGTPPIREGALICRSLRTARRPAPNHTRGCPYSWSRASRSRSNFWRSSAAFSRLCAHCWVTRTGCRIGHLQAVE